MDGPEHSWRITLASDEPFGFAGLWESWKSPEGQGIETTTTSTTDASKSLQPIHHRMPMIVNPSDYDSWLEPDTLKLLVRSYPDELVRAYRVSTVVNNVPNDGLERIVELAA